MAGQTALSILEFVGLFVFAISGALTAIEKDFDAVGIVILAEVTALGGGVLRDVIIGDIPPAAFRDVGYVPGRRLRSGTSATCWSLWPRRRWRSSPTRSSGGWRSAFCWSTLPAWVCSR
jgi:uncharacterized membrane protein YeiH